MKIKSIYIDGLHNAVNKTYTFGDIAYIFGNNGIGKSTILQAIQYALLGYIPGTAKNSKEAILRHSPKGSIEVKICLTDTGLDSDIVVTRKVTSAGTKVETTPENMHISDIIQDLELPIFNFNEFVGQTANKLKEYFIKNILPTVNDALDWKTILTNSILECNFTDRADMVKYGISLIPTSGDSDNILSQVIEANDKFKEELSFNKSELQRLQNTIDSLIYYDDYVGPTNLDEINSNLLSLSAIRDELIRYESAASVTQSAQQELARLKEDMSSMGGEEAFNQYNVDLSHLKQQYKELSEVINTKTTVLASLRATDTATDSVIQSKGICPYTKETCKSILDKIEDLRNESVKRKAANLELSKEIDEANAQLNDMLINIRKIESNISDFNTTWNRIVTLEKTMTDLPQKPNTDKTVFDLDAEIARLTDNKEKLQANIHYNETIDNITQLKYNVELQIEALSKWVKATDTNGLQTTLMLAPFDELAEKMTTYIRKMYNNNSIKAHFNISSKANSFSFGLIRDNVYIPYDMLSSGEKCLYSLALMICIVNNTSSPLKILLCDDMFDHLDSNSIESTFATLKTIHNIQFIFAGVKECNNASDIILTV